MMIIKCSKACFDDFSDFQFLGGGEGSQFFQIFFSKFFFLKTFSNFFFLVDVYEKRVDVCQRTWILILVKVYFFVNL